MNDAIQKVFPGAEQTTLGRAKKICILSDIRVIDAMDDQLDVYICDSEGMEYGGSLLQKEYQGGPLRKYHCKNCGYQSDGSEDFTMRSHLGKFHEMIDPFDKYP